MKNKRKIVLDFETTGYSVDKHEIIEIGALILEPDGVFEEFNTYVHTDQEIKEHITKLTGITRSTLKDAPSQKEASEMFIDFIGSSDFVMIGHNAMRFDSVFFEKFTSRKNFVVYDTMLQMRCDLVGLRTRNFIESQKSKVSLKRGVKTNLEAASKYYKIKQLKQHRASVDCDVTAKIFFKQLKINKWQTKLF